MVVTIGYDLSWGPGFRRLWIAAAMQKRRPSPEVESRSTRPPLVARAAPLAWLSGMMLLASESGPRWPLRRRQGRLAGAARWGSVGAVAWRWR